MEPATILLVEDDPALAQTLHDVFEMEGYTVRAAATGAQARASLADPAPDVILLDLMLPDTDGLILCADLKSKLDVPIIICSATSRKRDAVLGLKLGADDFVPKPFDVDELITRVETAVRRSRASASAAKGESHDSGSGAAPTGSRERAGGGAPIPIPASTSVDGLTLEHAHRSVTFHDETINLTPTEYRLLAAFMVRPDEVLSRRDLAQLVWGYEDASVGRSIDVHVHRLRTKLLAAQERQNVPGPNVISVRGFGYKLYDSTAAAVAA